MRRGFEIAPVNESLVSNKHDAKHYDNRLKDPGNKDLCINFKLIVCCVHSIDHFVSINFFFFTVRETASAVRFTRREDERRHDRADTHQIEKGRFFITRIGWMLARFKNERFKPANKNYYCN